jgi:CheY-like chemotaxis protein
MKLNLLIVEDSEAVIAQWKEKLEFYSVGDAPKYEIEHKIVTKLSEAKALLDNTQFEAAVIDIRLDENGTQTDHGNDVLAHLSESSLTVCAIHTGEPGTEIIKEHQKEFVQVFKKGDGDGIDNVLLWLDKKVDMVSAIKSMQDSFSKSMAEAFTKSIWPRWSHWLSAEENPNLTVQALTRHMASHLHASFLNEVSSVHPEEHYFIPPLQDRLDTGDIFFIEGEHFILVTPRCDLAREKNPTFQLVNLKSVQEEWLEHHELKSNEANSKKIKESAQKSIEKLVNHGDRSPKLHFIPQVKLSSDEVFGPFHAQFNFMDCIEASDIARETLASQRIATLSNEFVPSLVERLGAYFSRIGTPDYSHPE